MSKQFTVIGLWESDGSVFVYYTAAKDEYEAMQNAAQSEKYDSNLVILGAVGGIKKFLYPGCDNIAAVYAPDLKPEKGE